MPKKTLIITLVILGLVAYIGASFWVIRMMKQNTVATTTTLPQTNLPVGTRTDQPPTDTPTPQPTPTPMPTPTPIPTPTPLQGPGIYACDPDGICNNYSDDMRKPCPKTFADPNCLNMCGTPSVRCPN